MRGNGGALQGQAGGGGCVEKKRATPENLGKEAIIVSKTIKKSILRSGRLGFPRGTARKKKGG